MSDDLSRVMRETTEDLHPNIGKLTAGGIERGTRKRRMRRISQIAGAAASVTAVFGVVAMVGTPGSHNSNTSVSAASGADAAAVAKSSPAAPKTSDAKSGPTVTGDDMVKALEQELAPYHLTNETVLYKGGTGDGSGAYATLKFGYGTGEQGSASLTVSRSSWDQQGFKGTVPFTTVQNLNDGSHLVVFDGPEWPAGNGDPKAKRLEVSWYRTDGSLVNIMVLNQAMEKGAVTGTDLALTADQATKVVQSPTWKPAIAAVLADTATPKISQGAKPNGSPTSVVSPAGR